MKISANFCLTLLVGTCACADSNTIGVQHGSVRASLSSFEPATLTVIVAAPVGMLDGHTPSLAVTTPDLQPAGHLIELRQKTTDGSSTELLETVDCWDAKLHEFSIAADESEWQTYWSRAETARTSVGLAFREVEPEHELRNPTPGTFGFALVDALSGKKILASGCLQSDT